MLYDAAIFVSCDTCRPFQSCCHGIQHEFSRLANQLCHEAADLLTCSAAAVPKAAFSLVIMLQCCFLSRDGACSFPFPCCVLPFPMRKQAGLLRSDTPPWNVCTRVNILQANCLKLCPSLSARYPLWLAFSINCRSDDQDASCHSGNETGEKLIKDSFAVAAAAGFNVVRTYAHTTDARYPFKVNTAPASSSGSSGS